MLVSVGLLVSDCEELESVELLPGHETYRYATKPPTARNKITVIVIKIFLFVFLGRTCMSAAPYLITYSLILAQVVCECQVTDEQYSECRCEIGV